MVQHSVTGSAHIELQAIITALFDRPPDQCFAVLSKRLFLVFEY